MLMENKPLVPDDFIRVHEAPLYTLFSEPTESLDEYIHSEKMINTHKAILDDRGNVISVVGKGYNVVQMQT